MREMKDSGVEWIGEVPAGWDMLRLVQLAAPVKHKNVGLAEQNLLSLSYGNIVRKSIEKASGLVPASYEGYNIIERDDVVLRFTDLQNDKKSLRTGLARERGLITSAYLTVRPDSRTVVPEFFHFVLHSVDVCKVFYNMGDGMRQTLDWRGVNRMLLPVPPLSEQRAIAGFLDGRCAAIDADIAKRREVIAKLGEYRKSVIAKAVTKGLDPDAEMKDSGVGWIGEVPAGWDVVRGKYAYGLLSRGVRDGDDVITCFRDGEVTLRTNRRDEGFTFADKEIGYQGINPGDLVVHGMDGFAGSIGISDSRGKASPVLRVLDSAQNKRYLMYLLRTYAYLGVYLSIADGIRVRSCNLSWNKLAELPVLLPPLSEQRAIAGFLDGRCAAIDEAVSRQERIIDRLQEYRKSLIHHAVTGKIDCREA